MSTDAVIPHLSSAANRGVLSPADRPQRYVFFSDVVARLNARGPSHTGWYSGLCPAHDDRHASFSFTERDGKFGFHCHRGCDYGDIVSALEAIGLWPINIDKPVGPPRHKAPELPLALLEFDAELVSPKKGIVEAYLAERGIKIAPLQDILQHRRAWHPPSSRSWPCMVAAVRDVAGHVRSLHRTFLSYTYPPTKAAVEPARLLWPGTSSRGCAIHLAPAFPKMLIAEGIETTAAAMQRYGLPGWSTISASNMRVVELPDFVRDVVICADNDEPGLKAAIAAAQRFRREGRTVRIEKPANVKDFNDLLLMGRAP